MKNIFPWILLCISELLFQQATGQTAQRGGQSDTAVRYYTRLASSPNAEDKTLLEAKLYTLLKSNNESDWLMASRFFSQLKKNNTADSITKASKAQFPFGQVARNEGVKTVYDEKDPVKKEATYEAWVKKFPPEKFGSDRIVYDYARNSVANAYAQADNVKKALQFANMTETPIWKGEGWAGPAMIFLRNNHLPEATELLKKAAANSYKYMNTNKADNGARFAATGYIGYTSSLAEILFRQKKYDEALKYAREAHDSSSTVRANVNSTYADILIALGKDKEAFEIINEAVKAGQATAEMKANLKTLYIKVKGSNAGYDEYMASMNKILAEKIKKDVAKQMISKAAPMFVLKDVDGNTVSLEDYKGKIVVLDFWATWCGPCKRSFPAMKMAVEKFKNDPNVKFLFIHTWEREDNAAKNAKKYIDEQHYPFELLMDLKDPATGLNKVLESYKISAIPAKFVIDGKGNIRFSLSGFSGGDDAAVEELTAMIEMAKS